MELGYAERYEGGVKFLTTYVPSLISCGNDYIINEISADTIYRFTQDHKLVPLLTRKPPVGEPESFIALLALLETNRYLFIQTIKNEYNLKTLEGFPCTELMYDKVEGEIYEYKIYSDDYAEREVVWGRGEKQYIKEENKIYQYLKAPDLVKAYQEGKLKGRLSELASQLNEEDNGIVMLIHFK